MATAKKKGTRTFKRGAPQGKSRTGLVLAAVAVVGLAGVGVAAAFLALPKENAGTRTGSGRARNDRASKPTPAADSPDAGRERALEDYWGRAGLARTAAEHLARGMEAENLGLPDDAAKHFEKALELEPANETALEKLGFERYSLPDAASGLPAEFFEDLQAEEGKWLPPGDMKKLREREQEALAAARAEMDLREKDPFHARVVEILRTLENVKGFKDYLFHTRRSDPYLLIEHVGKKGFNPYRSEEAEKLAAQKVEGLKLVFAYVVENFMKPAGLGRDENRPLGVVSFEDRAVFEEFQRAIGQNLPPGAAAYFNPMTKFVIMNNAPGALEGPEEVTLNILIHEATHQIVDAHCNPAGGMKVQVSLWANEGIAEYTASMRLKPRPDGSFEYLLAYELSSGRLAEFYAARFPKKFKERTAFDVSAPYALTLAEMVQMKYMQQCYQLVLQKWMAAGGKNPMTLDPGSRARVLAIAGSLIYAQATSFFFFCLQGKPGDYKDKLMEYLRREFEGRVEVRGAKTFKEIFGDDLAAIEREWLAYVDTKTTADIKEGHMY